VSNSSSSSFIIGFKPKNSKEISKLFKTVKFNYNQEQIISNNRLGNFAYSKLTDKLNNYDYETYLHHYSEKYKKEINEKEKESFIKNKLSELPYYKKSVELLTAFENNYEKACNYLDELLEKENYNYREDKVWNKLVKLQNKKYPQEKLYLNFMKKPPSNERYKTREEEIEEIKTKTMFEFLKKFTNNPNLKLYKFKVQGLDDGFESLESEAIYTLPKIDVSISPKNIVEDY
jgi:hypothetical protein